VLLAGLLCVQLKLIKFRVGHIWQLSIEICSKSSRKFSPMGAKISRLSSLPRRHYSSLRPSLVRTKALLIWPVDP